MSEKENKELIEDIERLGTWLNKTIELSNNLFHDINEDLIRQNVVYLYQVQKKLHYVGEFYNRFHDNFFRELTKKVIVQ